MKDAKSNLRLTLIVIILFFLHEAYASHLAIRGAQPNIALTGLLTCSLFTDATFAAWLGFMTGILESAYLGMYIGSLIVTRSLAGWIIGAMEPHVFRDNVVIAVGICFLGTFLTGMCFYLFAPQANTLLWVKETLEESIYNCVISIPIYYIVKFTV